MSKLKWPILIVVVSACPWGAVHAHLCANVFRQADKLIVKPEAYNLVIRDQPALVKTSPDGRRTELKDGAARSATMSAQALTKQGSARSAADDLRRGQAENPTNRSAARSGEVAPLKPDLPAKPKHVLQVHAVSVTPEIDGVIKEPAWKSAAVLANFSSVAGGQAVYDTRGLLLYDSKNLYVGLYCNDENIEALTEQDGIEFRLTRNAEGRPAYSLFLSPVGKVVLKRILSDAQSTVWPASGIRYVVGKDKCSWTAEMVIPFSALNVPAPGVQTRWYLRVIRTKADGNAETSFWAPAASGYNSEKGFGTFELVP